MVEGLNVNVREALVTFKCCWLVNISLRLSHSSLLCSYAGFKMGLIVSLLCCFVLTSIHGFESTLCSHNVHHKVVSEASKMVSHSAMLF